MDYNLSDEFTVVRFNARHIIFPEICPVCGKPATKDGVISSTVFRPAQSPSGRRESNHGYLMTLASGNKCNVRCRIPVCEDHYNAADNSERIKSILLLFFGVSIMAFLLVSTWLAFSIIDGVRVNSLSVILWTSVFISAWLVWNRLGNHELGKAISISDKSVADTYWQIRVKHDWYRDELLTLNPMNAEVARYRDREK
jgi:hypothetical protein